MAKKSNYSKLLKKAIFAAKIEASPEFFKKNKKIKLQQKANKMANKMTKPERIFALMLKELNIEFDVQKIIGNKIFDFYIPSKNIIIEVDGDYFHGNPLIYESVDLNKMQIRNMKNDLFKDKLAIGNGYRIERIWEYDLHNNYQTQKERFNKILNDE